ncbi:MAG: helix-turn-helix domain-containing protein [Microbacterium sp.]
MSAVPIADAVASRGAQKDSCRRTPEGAAIRDVLDRVGDKWSLLVISVLRERTLRFSELHQQIPGISQRMLTRTLRQLERDGLVSRTVHAEVPPRVEYALTGLGAGLIEITTALAAWAVEHLPEVQEARASYDARAGRSETASGA